MGFRLTRQIVEAKAKTVNSLLGTQGGQAPGSVYIQGAYGGYAVQRCTKGGGTVTVGNGYGTLREAAQVLDGMIEGIRLAQKEPEPTPHPSETRGLLSWTNGKTGLALKEEGD